MRDNQFKNQFQSAALAISIATTLIGCTKINAGGSDTGSSGNSGSI